MKTFRKSFWKSVYAPSLIIWGIGLPVMIVSLLLSLGTWNDLLTMWTIFLSVSYGPILDTFREKEVYVQTVNIARAFKRSKLPLF